MTLKVENMKGEVTVIGKPIVVPGESFYQTPFFVKVDEDQIQRRKTELVIGVYEGNKKIKTAKTTFMGPEF